MKKRVVWCEDRPVLFETLETLFETKKDVIDYFPFASSEQMAAFLESNSDPIDVIIVDDLMPPCDRWPGDETDEGLETGVRIAETVGQHHAHNKTFFISYSLHQSTFEFYTEMEKLKRFKRMLKANYSPFAVEDFVLEVLGL